jgi:hypothetical protein
MRKSIPTTPCGVFNSITTVGGGGAAALINTTRILLITEKLIRGGVRENTVLRHVFAICLNPRVYARPKNRIRFFFFESSFFKFHKKQNVIQTRNTQKSQIVTIIK